MDAAVDCLAEHGWTNTTVALVAEQAGVSRGAAQHHFPTRENLVVATVEFLAEEQINELRRRAGKLPRGRRRAEPVARMLLNLYTGQMFRAALHLWIAASTEDSLRSVVAPLEDRVGREAHRVVVELLGADESVPGVRETVQATLDLARGLGLANLLSDDSKRRERLVRQWATVLEPIVGQRR